MAQGIRPRPLTGAATIARRWPLLALAACGGAAAGLPAPAGFPELPAAAAVQLVLEGCHTGLDGMDRVQVAVTTADGATLHAFADLPDRVRAQTADGRVLLLVAGAAMEVRDATATPLPDAEAARLRALATLLDAAALGPLRRAERCERLGPGTFRLSPAAGAPWELTLRAGSLLVERLRGPGGDVEVLAHLQTSTTWVVQRARCAPLGECTLRFERQGFDWDAALFTPPQQRPSERPPSIRQGGEPRPGTPVLEQEPGLRWLLMDDPGDWPQRAALVQQRCELLEAQDQELKGFAGLLREEGRDLLVLPFAGAAGAEFAAPPDWNVRQVPARRVLLVFPPAGDYAERVAAGTELLQRALAAQRLEAAGPILAQPYFHLDEGPPPADRLAAPVVRMTVPVR